MAKLMKAGPQEKGYEEGIFVVKRVENHRYGIIKNIFKWKTNDKMAIVKDQNMQTRAGLVKQCQLQSWNFAKELFTSLGTLPTVHRVEGVKVLEAVKAKYWREPSDYKSIEPPLSTLKDKNAKNKITGKYARLYHLEMEHT